MKKMLIAAALAATTVLAQTGDFGRAVQMDGTMMGATTFHTVLGTLFFTGLVLLVWLWVFKLWKEVKRMK